MYEKSLSWGLMNWAGHDQGQWHQVNNYYTNTHYINYREPDALERLVHKQSRNQQQYTKWLARALCFHLLGAGRDRRHVNILVVLGDLATGTHQLQFVLTAVPHFAGPLVPSCSWSAASTCLTPPPPLPNVYAMTSRLFTSCRKVRLLANFGISLPSLFDS